MEQRVFHGRMRPEDLAQALLDEWDRDDTIAQAFSEPGRALVQIGQREGGWFGDEPHQAITLDIEALDDGLQVTMGQQQWIKDGMQIFAGGLIGFFPFFFTFPLGGLFGGGDIDQSLPGRIWQTVERYAGNTGAATGKTQRLSTMPCPECGVANPQNAERCSACGASLMPSPACPNCAHVNPPGARFCNRCGAALLVAA
ncbi:MAG TPA: zinc ribbon domain-containing protein [Herpetosiphonaceae bacterium]|nr:zinc ribbon domain-containing protein [Herpetosiphonaceae bacterium]